MLLLKRTVLVVLLQRFLMTWIRLVLILYFLMVAHKAACQTLSKAFYEDIGGSGSKRDKFKTFG